MLLVAAIRRIRGVRVAAVCGTWLFPAARLDGSGSLHHVEY